MAIARKFTTAAAVLAIAGCGAAVTAQRGDAGATAGKLERFVLTKTDLPAGYALEDARRASSRNSCLEGLDRSVKRKLASLGLQRCALAKSRRDVDLGSGDGGGRGLNGIQERVTSLRGQMSAGPDAGGWGISVRLPLHPTP